VGEIIMKSGRNINMQTSGFRLQAQTVDISVSGQWTETTRNKTENTTYHKMNANVQDINGESTVDIDGGRIDLN
jgi:hypothetical protein